MTTTPPATGAVDAVTWDLPYGEPSSLDWLHAAAYSENTVLANLCEGLLRETPDLKIEPSLASAFSNPNPTTWTYTLRSGVKFTDGTPMTAADAVYSLKRNMDPKLGSFWGVWYANVKSITASGSTVTVKLKKPDATFNQFLATAGGVVAEKAYVEKAGASYGTAKGGVMCTGPYSLTKWTPGTGITTKANPGYWDSAHRPKVGAIDYKFITNPSTLADALSSGEVDGTYEAPISAVPQLQKSSVGKLYLGKSLQFSNIVFTSRPGPIQDVKVRQALSVMLDRAAIAKAIFHGTATPVRSNAFPSTWGYGKAVYEQAYDELPDISKPDVEKATALVKSAGSVREMKVLVNADDVAATQLGTYLQSTAKQIGLDLRLVQLPAAQTIAASFDPKRQAQYDLIISNTNYYDVPEPLELQLLSLTKGGVFNTFGYDNPQVGADLVKAQSTTDPDARAKLIAKAELQAYGKDWVASPIVNYAERLFMNNRISGAPASITSYLYYPWGASLGGTGK